MSAQRWLSAGGIAFQAWVLFLAGERGIALLVMAGLAWALVGRPLKLHPVVWWTVVAVAGAGITLAWRAQVQLAGEGDLASLSWALPAAAWLVAVQTLELTQPPGDERRMWRAGGLGMFALVLLFHAPNFPGTPATSLTWAIVGVAAWSLAQGLSGPGWAESSSWNGPRWSALAVLLSATALVAWLIDDYVAAQLPRFQAVVIGQLARRVNAQGLARSYGWRTTLDGVSIEKQRDPTAIALRVYCRVPPGYLRAAAFDALEGEQWTIYDRADSGRRAVTLHPSPPSRPLPPPPPGVAIPVRERVFAMDDAARGSLTRLDILNDPLRGPGYFTPLGAAYLDGAGREVLLTEHGIVRRGLDIREPYTVWAAATPRSAAPSLRARPRLLDVPPMLAAQLDAVLPRISAARPLVEDKVAAIEGYFQDNYSYSLRGFKPPRGEPALAYFLRARPAAHCEYFASAAVLLLRRQGIPARYVTGYVVTEPDSELDELWLARNRHAHAWAEAYDDRQGRWIIVEATPGVEVPKDVDGGSGPEAGGGSNLASGDADIQSAYALAAIWDRWRQWNPTTALWWLALGVCALGGLWLVWRRLPARRARSPQSQRLAWLLRLDRQVGRSKFRRAGHETLHQFAARLRAAAVSDPWLSQAAQWYLGYAQACYGGGPAEVSPPPRPDNWRLWRGRSPQSPAAGKKQPSPGKQHSAAPGLSVNTP